MCSAISGIHTAQVKWTKYTQDNASRCGIPPEAVKQLRQGQDNLAKLRKSVCSGGAPTAAAAGPPRLSDALGTAGLPASTTTGGNTDEPKKRGGVLDNMTGTPIR